MNNMCISNREMARFYFIFTPASKVTIKLCFFCACLLFGMNFPLVCFQDFSYEVAAACLSPCLVRHNKEATS